MKYNYSNHSITLYREDLISASLTKRNEDMVLSDFSLPIKDACEAYHINFLYIDDDDSSIKFITLKDRFGVIHKGTSELSWEELCQYAFDKNLTVNKSNCIIINTSLFFMECGDVFLQNGDISQKLGNGKLTYKQMKIMIDILVEE